MKRIFGLTTALMLVAAVAYGQDVSYNFDQQADFSRYQDLQVGAGEGRGAG